MAKISTIKLRQLALSNQGLTVNQTFGKGMAGTLRAIEHLGYVQIDTLSVVERAHHHVLWSRVPDYDLNQLNSLVAKQQIFEYWFHAAAYLPMRDYRFALIQMHSIRSGKNRYHQKADQKLMQEILACVDIDGPLRLRDLDNKFKGTKVGQGTWWNMAPGKRAIVKLFMQGDLMVCERKGMEKVYDLTERCLPDNIDLSMPTEYEYATYLYDTTCRAHVVFTLKQLLHLKTGNSIRDAMQAVLKERMDAGEILEITGDGLSAFYVDAKAIDVLNSHGNSKTLKILSPFDNVLIHRERLSSLFNYDYRMECYVPQAKRQYGYFCLPILYGERFVGRIDCKAHRSEGRFEVVSLHLEDGMTESEELYTALKNELQSFADFNQCTQHTSLKFQK